MSIFVGLLVAAAYQATKLCQWGDLVFPAAVISYAFTFAMTDAIAEVWGKAVARKVVMIGFAVLVLAMFANYISLLLPAAPWFDDSAYQSVVGSSGRIIVASLIAYIASQTHDVWAFHMWKEKTKGRFLWWRNNASTLVSQAIDTTIFITLAFYGVVPDILALIAGQYIIKLLIALADTPVVYGLVLSLIHI